MKAKLTKNILKDSATGLMKYLDQIRATGAEFEQEIEDFAYKYFEIASELLSSNRDEIEVDFSELLSKGKQVILLHLSRAADWHNEVKEQAAISMGFALTVIIHKITKKKDAA